MTDRSDRGVPNEGETTVSEGETTASDDDTTTSTDDTIYFEDVEPGTVTQCGSTTVSREEIIEFAEEYDPLDIHTDLEAAAESPYGDVIASGYHTLSLSVRLLVDAARGDRAVIAGLGIDDVRWHAPVRPGDTLAVEFEILETRPSESNPAAGIIHESITVRNGDDETVLTLENSELVERREPADEGEGGGE
ncbi:Acyl dehydratase [Halopenitus malekzadehii]|uniref:Acyl dehydratase n=1 Tax=Halopenitus malekzadehii TaxID=1267564 RepID=A0A1H6HQA2_9EURY|nr:MaoC family dehydratase [Halopenitus malekzadehii]SEH38089.1 Acyl dehydratase [Halopenitus malekzadehii]